MNSKYETQILTNNDHNYKGTSELAYVNGTIGLMEVGAREVRIILIRTIEVGATNANTYVKDCIAQCM